MKKIYSKITKERRKQFQIETYIMKDGEQRLVVKRALAKEMRGNSLNKSAIGFNKKMIKRFGYDMHYSPEPDTLAYLLNCNVKIREIQVEMHERIAGVSYLDFKGSIWYMMKMLFSILLFQWVRRKVKE